MIPSEYGMHSAERNGPSTELLQTAAALGACLQQLVERLAVKGSLSAQEFLDTLVRASDDIQRGPHSAIAVIKIEEICREIAAMPGVTRASGKSSP